MKPWTHLPQMLMGERGKYENSELNLLILTVNCLQVILYTFILVSLAPSYFFFKFTNRQVSCYIYNVNTRPITLCFTVDKYSIAEELFSRY